MQFDLPKNMMIVGSTQSGKTQFVNRLLLNHRNAFKQSVALIIYCYGAWQPALDELESGLGDLVDFRPDIPSSEELVSIRRDKVGPEGGEIVLVLDDKMNSLKENAQGTSVLETVCVTAHHSRISCILTLQNLFHNKIVRAISLNCHYLCLFRNNRSVAQVRTLGTQIFPGQLTYFMDSYERATSPSYGYLFIDLTPNGDRKLRLRTKIFNDDDHMIVYSPVR
jgi:hypothetical protein